MKMDIKKVKSGRYGLKKPGECFIRMTTRGSLRECAEVAAQVAVALKEGADKFDELEAKRLNRQGAKGAKGGGGAS